MPRRARLKAAGMPWHVIQRGNNRMVCFAETEDYEFYLGLVAERARASGCAVHAYVLMTNHVHLLVTPDERDAVSNLMKSVSERYARRFNKRQGRTGTLWEGRFRSCLVDSDGYLVACQRYIECNPVRAGMVPHARDYPWSSHRANAEGEPTLIVTPHPLFETLGANAEGRRRAYRAMSDSPIEDDTLERIRNCINSGLALGRDEFLKNLKTELHRPVEPGPMGRPRKAPPSDTIGGLF